MLAVCESSVSQSVSQRGNRFGRIEKEEKVCSDDTAVTDLKFFLCDCCTNDMNCNPLV